VHEILEKSLDQSPLYNGQIKSIGPRYCPSIETKIVTFADKESHQLFLEPEGESTEEYYLNGFSSSLPYSVQLEALKQIPAFSNIRLYRPGYAIEYDYFIPTQLKHTLETKLVGNLFFAGQINGTTGYEEAAGQGIIAGINAHMKANGNSEFVLQRNEAYIGVLIDDLVIKGVDEPYRMFTSRAEHRILLRQDNADARLTEKGYETGLCTSERFLLWKDKERQINELKEFIKTLSVMPQEVNSYLEAKESSPLLQKSKLIDILSRPQVSLNELIDVLPSLRSKTESIKERKEEILEETEITIKYEGYIKREELNADKLTRLEKVPVPSLFDYEALHTISTEARQKLSKIQPKTIGEASRIPGVSPNDISILLLFLKR
jgi:tRNA uridine 5-carboxymethylaminomethyl modification enzyme